MALNSSLSLSRFSKVRYQIFIEIWSFCSKEHSCRLPACLALHKTPVVHKMCQCVSSEYAINMFKPNYYPTEWDIRSVIQFLTWTSRISPPIFQVFVASQQCKATDCCSNTISLRIFQVGAIWVSSIQLDYAPSDFHLYRYLKSFLCNQRLNTEE